MAGPDLAQRLAFISDQLRDVSANGLHFSKSPYDQMNYHHIQNLAVELLGLATAQPAVALEALRGPIFSRMTPYVTGDAAIMDNAERLLLIRRSDNGLWAMPGGALEVGETPAEGVVREALEETGWHSEVVALMGVYDSRYCGTTAPYHLYQFQFLCRPVWQEPSATFAQEALEIAWFAEPDLPDPAHIDPGHRTRIPFCFRFQREPCAAYFDRPQPPSQPG